MAFWLWVVYRAGSIEADNMVVNRAYGLDTSAQRTQREKALFRQQSLFPLVRLLLN